MIESYLVHLQVSMSESSKVHIPEAPDSLPYFFAAGFKCFVFNMRRQSWIKCLPSLRILLLVLNNWLMAFFRTALIRGKGVQMTKFWMDFFQYVSVARHLSVFPMNLLPLRTLFVSTFDIFSPSNSIGSAGFGGLGWRQAEASQGVGSCFLHEGTPFLQDLVTEKLVGLLGILDRWYILLVGSCNYPAHKTADILKELQDIGDGYHVQVSWLGFSMLMTWRYITEFGAWNDGMPWIHRRLDSQVVWWSEKVRYERP